MKPLDAKIQFMRHLLYLRVVVKLRLEEAVNIALDYYDKEKLSNQSFKYVFNRENKTDLQRCIKRDVYWRLFDDEN